MILGAEYKHRGGIYRIVCAADGSVYIGQTCDFWRRSREHYYDLKNHCNHSPLLQEAYDKHGLSSLAFEVVYERNDDSEDLDDMERLYIERARVSGKCMNVFDGGVASFTVPDSFRETTSRTHTGLKRSDETKRRHAESTKKQWAENEEYANLMKDSAKRQWKNPEYRKIMHDAHTGNPYACGHKLTKEQVIEMRSLWSTGSYTRRQLAEKYNMAYSSVVGILNGLYWKNI